MGGFLLVFVFLATILLWKGAEMVDQSPNLNKVTWQEKGLHKFTRYLALIYILQ